MSVCVRPTCTRSYVYPPIKNTGTPRVSTTWAFCMIHYPHHLQHLQEPSGTKHSWYFRTPVRLQKAKIYTKKTNSHMTQVYSLGCWSVSCCPIVHALIVNNSEVFLQTSTKQNSRASWLATFPSMPRPKISRSFVIQMEVYALLSSVKYVFSATMCAVSG